MKKFLSLLLSVAIVLSMLCLPAVANTTTADITLKQADLLVLSVVPVVPFRLMVVPLPRVP